MNWQRLIIIFIIFLLEQYGLTAYEQLLFKPLTANVFEPRIGCLYQFGSSSFNNQKLRLDIGASFDLAGFKFDNDSSQIRFGTDWFTFTRLRSEGKMKFPVETSDYFFGVNTSIKAKLFGMDLFGRLRLAHISSHLVDGMATGEQLRQVPFVYSREFADLTAAVVIRNIRYYLGLAYVFSYLPKDTEEIIPHFGMDFKLELTDWFCLNTGFDFRFPGLDPVWLSTAYQFGLLFKTSENVGIILNISDYVGKSIHGMFFKNGDNYISVGFQLIYYGLNF